MSFVKQRRKQGFNPATIYLFSCFSSFSFFPTLPIFSYDSLSLPASPLQKDRNYWQWSMYWISRQEEYEKNACLSLQYPQICDPSPLTCNNTGLRADKRLLFLPGCYPYWSCWTCKPIPLGFLTGLASRSSRDTFCWALDLSFSWDIHINEFECL